LVAVLLLCLVSAVTLSGCQLVKPKLGSARNPIKLYFVPSVEVAVIVESGEAIAEYLKSQTGYEFEVKVPTTYAAVIEELGAAEQDAMAFIPAMGYVIANEKYGVEVALTVVRFGWGYYWAQYIVPRDSPAQSLKDLDGKSWAYGSVTSTSGYLVPKSYFVKNGINPGQEVETGGHNQSVIAVYEGQADFGTTFFSAPGNDWKVGDPPEPAGDIEVREENGSTRVYVGGQRIRDARASVLSTYKDVVNKVRILEISDPIPNDTVSYCKGFPEDMKAKINKGLMDFAKTEEGKAVLENDKFYDISDFEPVADSKFDPIRDMIKGLGMQEDDILK
jgi:phosphonate transport system substrate-binding protein